MRIINQLKGKIRKLIYNKYYYWYIVRKNREKKTLHMLADIYSQKKDTTSDCPICVVNIYEGDIKSGGLADRLRGIVSTYSVCKELGIRYKLFFSDPFPLSDYLVPAKYDWSICREYLSFDSNCENCVVLDTTQESDYQKSKQEAFLKKRLKEIAFQTHVYTNAGFSYDKDFYHLYNELFKPSLRLQNAIDLMLTRLGTRYVSVSCRFLNLLGDFNEPCGYKTSLSKNEIDVLISKIEKVIEEIHEKWVGFTVLLNSDSRLFLDRLSVYEYIEINDGNITHIDNEKSDYSYETYEKTFLDLYGIANASHIYLIKDSRMFKSGFPYMASKIGNVKFEIIEIED